VSIYNEYKDWNKGSKPKPTKPRGKFDWEKSIPKKKAEPQTALPAWARGPAGPPNPGKPASSESTYFTPRPGKKMPPKKVSGPEQPQKKYGPPSPTATTPSVGSPSTSRSSHESPSGGGGSQAPMPAAARAVAASQKVGKYYRDNRADYKAEKANNAGTGRPATADGAAPESKFDFAMDGADFKKKRDAFLASHKGLRDAIKNKTMTMGDANLAVRRMSANAKKKIAAAAAAGSPPA